MASLFSIVQETYFKADKMQRYGGFYRTVTLRLNLINAIIHELNNRTKGEYILSGAHMSESRKQHIYVMRELTKREIKRKYARSYLGILWSVLEPLLNMLIVTFLFSYIFSKNIENYPAYYFTGYIVVTFFGTATRTAMTALKDNKGLMLKTKLPRRTFVLSRVYTALVNFGFSCLAFIVVLIIFQIRPTWTMLLFPVNIFFLTLFAIGVSYLISIWFVFQQDSKNIYGNIISVLTTFTALFYSIDALAPGVRTFIQFNPIFTYVKIARDCILYGRISEPQYWIQMVAWAVGMFIIGRLVFNAKENRVIEKL